MNHSATIQGKITEKKVDIEMVRILSGHGFQDRKILWSGTAESNYSY